MHYASNGPFGCQCQLHYAFRSISTVQLKNAARKPTLTSAFAPRPTARKLHRILGYLMDLARHAADGPPHGLADIVDEGGICTSPVADATCRECADGRLQHCRKRLHDAVERLMNLMLEHFNREDSLMNALPNTGLAQVHCIRHREDHIAISMRYNKIIANLEAGDVASNCRTLEAVVSAWLHEHSRQFDMELASMLDGC